MSLFTLDGSVGICVPWTHSSIYKTAWGIDNPFYMESVSQNVMITIPSRVMPLFVLWICNNFGFRMITCEWKVRLKPSVVCKCIILGVSRSSLIITLFVLQICYLLSFWFPNDNLWAKNQMCGIPFQQFLLKLLQNNFNIWTYKVTLTLWDRWPASFY
jgi:hypothetical protein